MRQEVLEWEPAFQGEQKPNKGSHLGKLLYRSDAQPVLTLMPHGPRYSGSPCPGTISPSLLKFCFRSHHSCVNNFLSERNDPEFVTITKAARSAVEKCWILTLWKQSPHSHILLPKNFQHFYIRSRKKKTPKAVKSKLRELIALSGNVSWIE